MSGRKKNTDPPAPAAVLIGLMVFVCCALFTTSWISIGSLAVVGLVVILMTGLKLKVILTDMGKLWPLLFMTFLIHWLINSQVSGLSESDSGAFFRGSPLPVAMLFTVRFALIIGAMQTATLLHDPPRYGRAVGQLMMKMPFGQKLFGAIELTATLAMRFIPFVQSHYRRLDLALTAQGRPSSGKLVERLKRQRKLLYPLIFGSLRRADEVALALQARGFDPDVVRTSYHQAHLKGRTVVLTGLFAASCVLSVLIPRVI